jgi:hypothetical protein
MICSYVLPCLPLPRQSCPHVLCMHERDPLRTAAGSGSPFQRLRVANPGASAFSTGDFWSWTIFSPVQKAKKDSNSGDTTVVLSWYGAPLTTTLHARDSTRDPSRCFPKHFDRFANAMRIDGPLDSSKAHGGVAFPRRPQRRGAEDRRRSGSESHDAPSARVSPSSVCIESFGNDRPSACTALHPCNLHAFPCTGESCGRCDPDGPQRSPFGSLPAATSASVQRVSGREFSHRFRVPCYCCTTPYATRIFMTLRPTFFTARDKKK